MCGSICMASAKKSLSFVCIMFLYDSANPLIKLVATDIIPGPLRGTLLPDKLFYKSSLKNLLTSYLGRWV